MAGSEAETLPEIPGTGRVLVAVNRFTLGSRITPNRTDSEYIYILHLTHLCESGTPYRSLFHIPMNFSTPYTRNAGQRSASKNPRTPSMKLVAVVR
jgi:hypothetical protein